MYVVRPKKERGLTQTKKIISHHSFTFNRYYNQNYLAWSDLRVLNEYFVAPMGEFPTHAHRNQLVLTIVLKGILEHKDSAGNISQLKAGDIQLMSAGMGIQHSEYNPSEEDDLHFLQIWIAPRTLDEKPSYMQCPPLSKIEGEGFIPILSESGNNGQKIDQDIIISKGIFKENDIIKLPNEKRYYWLQVISGELSLNEISLQAGDGLHYFEEDLTLKAMRDDCHLLLLDMQIPK